MEARTLNKLRIIAIVWLVIIGLNALAAGYSFMAEPTGKDLGIPLSYLQFSPFDNYFIPGMFLFTTIGIFCMIAAFMGFKKHSLFPHALFVQGCILFGWIIIQIALVRDINALHVVCGISALAWMAIGFLFWKTSRDPF